MSGVDPQRPPRRSEPGREADAPLGLRGVRQAMGLGFADRKAGHHRQPLYPATPLGAHGEGALITEATREGVGLVRQPPGNLADLLQHDHVGVESAKLFGDQV